MSASFISLGWSELGMLRYWYSLGLQWKSALMLGLGLALLFSLFGLIAVQTLNQSTDAALQQRLAFAQMSAESVDDLITHTRHQLESVANLSTLTIGDQEDQTSALENIFHVLGSFETLRLLDSHGRVLWGKSLAPGKSLSTNTDLSARKDVSQVLADGETVVAQIPVADSEHPPIAVISVPVKDSRSRLRNVIQGELHLAHLGRELVPLPFASPTSRGSIVNSRGEVLASTEGREGAGGEQHLKLLEDFLSKDAAGVSVHRVSGVDHVVAFAPLDTLGGGVIVEARKDVLFALSQRLENALLIFGAASLGLASLAAWLYVRRVVHPLKALTEATNYIAQGKLESPITIDRRDEIGELGRSFESMRRQLLAAQEDRMRWDLEMEERVRLRTAQVRELMGKIISAQEEERKRIARELHDGAAQGMATVMLQMAALEESMSPGGEMEWSRELARRAKNFTVNTLDDLRRMIQDLRPSVLDDMGLVAAVRWYARTHLETAGIKVEFHCSGQGDAMDSNVETAVFRILQEAINNAARHAGAGQVTVIMSFDPDTLHAIVKDDGSGFDVEATRAYAPGVGIAGMEERAQLIGGRLSVNSRPGGGASIELEVPIGE